MPFEATATKLMETSVESDETNVEDKIVEDYKRLDQKCDMVMTKIKDRKAKKRKK